MQSVKRITAILFCILLVVLSAACGQTEPTATETQPAESQTSETTASSAPAVETQAVSETTTASQVAAATLMPTKADLDTLLDILHGEAFFGTDYDCRTDNVLDYLEDVFQCFYMYDIQFMQEDALDFAKLIKNSCEALDIAMGNFRSFKKNKKYREYIVNVNDYEEEADQLYLQTIRKLFKTYRDKPLVAHVWADIFNRMEKCSDATEHVADVMSTVYLKNS